MGCVVIDQDSCLCMYLYISSISKYSSTATTIELRQSSSVMIVDSNGRGSAPKEGCRIGGFDGNELDSVCTLLRGIVRNGTEGTPLSS